MGEASEEQDDFFIRLWMECSPSKPGAIAGIDGVVDDFDFAGIDAVLLGELVFGQVADGDDAGGGGHALLFDFEDAGMDVDAGAVEFGGVDLHDERFAVDGGDGDGGVEGHPVVGVDDVEGSPCLATAGARRA